MPVLPGIAEAIIEILTENAAAAAWATGGFHDRRAPPMSEKSADRRRDRYATIRVTDNTLEHKQVGPAVLTTDEVKITVWASSSWDAADGAHLIRKALDGKTGTAAGITIQRIFCRKHGVDRDEQDLSFAEQLIDGKDLFFDVAYTLP